MEIIIETRKKEKRDHHNRKLKAQRTKEKRKELASQFPLASFDS